MKKNLIADKSFEFALKIIEIVKFLQTEKREFVLSKQLLKSGTSIGANVEEASAAISKKDFILKMSIASKEARETRYWLKLLIKSELIPKEKVSSILNECEELIKIIATSIVTNYFFSLLITTVDGNRCGQKYGFRIRMSFQRL